MLLSQQPEAERMKIRYLLLYNKCDQSLYITRVTDDAINVYSIRGRPTYIKKYDYLLNRTSDCF